ncbi:hypothetical protein HYU13_01550 [Candidatus Woesearchaeota archaeon]|nr:hypothetical protein [Candidatus Woesearchaeota archaeon]
MVDFLYLGRYKDLLYPFDYDPAVAKGKLEELVSGMTEEERKEMDRCLFMTFEDTLRGMYREGPQRRKGMPYFTENPKSEEFHKFGIRIYFLMLTYSGSLAMMLREHEAGEDRVERLVEAAKSVFTFAKEGPMPDARPDIGWAIHYLHKAVLSNNFKALGIRRTKIPPTSGN